MDVDRVTHLLTHKSNDTARWINYNRATGARMSAMEHLVPEHKTAGAVLHREAAQWMNHMDVVNEMFSTEENPENGISAVKALQLAAAEGQKIWTITRANLDIALNGLQLPASVKTDIRNSVYAGKEVTAHERPVNFFDSSQVGYIVLDPETGAGAYLIGGGENGAFIALEYIINTLSFFYGLLVSVADKMGSKLPGLAKIVDYLTIAKFVYSLLSSGIKCKNNLSAVLFFITLTTVLSLLVVELVMMLSNPIAAFATGFALDSAFSWLVSQSGNCK